jgi:hypothetical protein
MRPCEGQGPPTNTIAASKARRRLLFPSLLRLRSRPVVILFDRHRRKRNLDLDIRPLLCWSFGEEEAPASRRPAGREMEWLGANLAGLFWLAGSSRLVARVQTSLQAGISLLIASYTHTCPLSVGVYLYTLTSQVIYVWYNQPLCRRKVLSSLVQGWWSREIRQIETERSWCVKIVHARSHSTHTFCGCQIKGCEEGGSPK